MVREFIHVQRLHSTGGALKGMWKGDKWRGRRDGEKNTTEYRIVQAK
jgi:hypothetical protein